VTIVRQVDAHDRLTILESIYQTKPSVRNVDRGAYNALSRGGRRTSSGRKKVSHQASPICEDYCRGASLSLRLP
jgi:hypothetical protein